jgi:hypothetical protein
MVQEELKLVLHHALVQQISREKVPNTVPRFDMKIIG